MIKMTRHLCQDALVSSQYGILEAPEIWNPDEQQSVGFKHSMNLLQSLHRIMHVLQDLIKRYEIKEAVRITCLLQGSAKNIEPVPIGQVGCTS